MQISRETLASAWTRRLKVRLQQGFIAHLQPGAPGGQETFWKTWRSSLVFWGYGVKYVSFVVAMFWDEEPKRNKGFPRT